jgi:O-antigen ligase
MSALAATAVAAGAGPRIAVERLRAVLLWLFAFAGSIVFVEPGPYEAIGLLTLFFFAVTGLTLRPPLAPFLLLLMLLNIGYAGALLQIIGRTDALVWVLVSVFLSATAVFFAAMLGTNTERRLTWLMRGCIASGVIVALLAIGGYFRLFGGLSDLFVLFGRAKGTFKDPNVFGAFLVLPGLLMFQRVLAGRRSEALGCGLLLLVLIGGLLLSFSRAAWGQFMLGTTLVMALSFVTCGSPSERVRIVIIALLGVVVALAFVTVLLSVERVADLFRERAALTQSYDIGHTGRFGRYLIAVDLILEHPLGLGPLQFRFPEAPHNTYLNSFVNGGWVGGLAYLALTLMTLVAGLRFVFVRTPWRDTFIVLYAAYVGIVVESLVIDSDHWRHYFLIVGVLWGLMAVSRPRLAAARAAGMAEEARAAPASRLRPAG